jgi:hypothetical protein
MGSLVRWVLAPVVCLAVFGAVPTWMTTHRTYGWDGVYAQAAAVGIVLVVMLGSGYLAVIVAQGGTGLISTAFLGGSLVRMVLCPVLMAVVWWATHWPVAPMGIWLVITYLACLTLEVVWVIRALRANARPKPVPSVNDEPPFTAENI